MGKRMVRGALIGMGGAGAVALAVTRRMGRARGGATRGGAGADSPVSPRARAVILPFLQRRFNPVMRRVAGRRHSPYALLRHTGRRSGRAYATPVVAARVGDDLLIPMTYGGATDWARNVLTAGRCVVELDGKRIEAEGPVVLAAAEALPLLPGPMRLGAGVIGIRRYLWVSPVARG